MDVKKFSLAHGMIVDSFASEILQKSVRYISDSGMLSELGINVSIIQFTDRLTFVALTTDNEVWALGTKSTRLLFVLSESSEVSAMTFLPSINEDEQCVAFAIHDSTNGDSHLRISNILTMNDVYFKAAAFPGRVTALTAIDTPLKPEMWSLSFGLASGSIGLFMFNSSESEVQIIESLQAEMQCQCPVTKLSWLKTRQLLVCGFTSGYLSVIRIPSQQVVFGHAIEGLPINSIVSTEPENDPRLTCFIWVSAANGRRSSAAIVFRVEGENDNVICMGVHDLAANIPDADTENAWAYLVDISSSKQIIHSNCDAMPSSSNLVSFLWEIGISGRSTDYYFALFDINAWFSWQSQANLHLKEPVFGGSKFLAVFRLPRSVSGDNRLLGAFAVSGSIKSFRPRVSIVPLTSPLLYPCSLSFDVLCICSEVITRIHYSSLQETLLKNCCNSVDFSRISETQLSSFVEKLTGLGLIDLFDGSSIGCSHHESVLNAFFKFANEGEAIRFAKKVLQNDNYLTVFRNWLFFRTATARKDFDVSIDLAFQNSEAGEHLQAVESDFRLILRLASCLPPSMISFARDLKRAVSIFLEIISSLMILLKPRFQSLLSDAFNQISHSSVVDHSPSFFERRLKLPYAEAMSSRERLLNLLTSVQLSNPRFDNMFLLLYIVMNAVKPQDNISAEILLQKFDDEFQKNLGIPAHFIRLVAVANFLDRKLPAKLIKQCLRLSRVPDFSSEDQVQLLKHLLKDDVSIAFEISLQLLTIHESENATVRWVSEVDFELFQLMLEAFTGRHHYEASLRLCLIMPNDAMKRRALNCLFKTSCIEQEEKFGSFMRVILAFSSVGSNEQLDPLRECITFMCTSKNRLLVERACVFFAKRGAPFLAEALAIANRANDLRFVSLTKENIEVDQLVQLRRQLIEQQLSKMPDYIRQRAIDKSRADDTAWMFVANPLLQLSFQNIETPEESSAEQCYKFDWDDVEKLLVLAANNPFVNSRYPPVTCQKLAPTSSFTTTRRSSALSLPGNSQSIRPSTAKKCRFVDSPEPNENALIEQVTPAAGISSAPKFFVSESDDKLCGLVGEDMPITPVVNKAYNQHPTPGVKSSCITIEDSDDDTEKSHGSSLSEEFDEETEEPQPPQITPHNARKRFAPSSISKIPSPAQKAARRILRRSVRFSCSPKSTHHGNEKSQEVIESQPTSEAYHSGVTRVASENFDDSEDDEVVEISSSEEEEAQQPVQNQPFSSYTFENENDNVVEPEWDEDPDQDDDEDEQGLYMEEEEDVDDKNAEVGDIETDAPSIELSADDDSDKMDAEIYLSPMTDSAKIFEETVSRKRSPSELSLSDQPVEKAPSVENSHQPNSTSDAREVQMSTQTEPRATRLIKSVLNISPNRLAAQMALRRSIRVASTKKRQELNDQKKTTSSSVEENKEPEKLTLAASSLRESPAEQLVPVVIVEKIISIPNVVQAKPPTTPEKIETFTADHRAPTPPLNLDDSVMSTASSMKSFSMVVESSSQPVTRGRMTRSRSSISNTEAKLNLLDISLNSTASGTTGRRRTRQTEAERLSPQSSIAGSDVGGVTTRTRSRRLSGSSDSAFVSVESSEIALNRSTRKRTQSTSESGTAADTIQSHVSPRRHVRKSLQASEVPRVVLTEPGQVVGVPLQIDAEIVANAALPPRPTRKRTQSQSSTDTMMQHGMVTPSTSPKRKVRNQAGSASVSKKEAPKERLEMSTMAKSAPSSPARSRGRPRKTSATAEEIHAEQAKQLHAALSKVVDSPAFHTRRHVDQPSSRASSINGGDNVDAMDATVAGNASPTGSIASTASTTTRRSTRSSAKPTAK